MNARNIEETVKDLLDSSAERIASGDIDGAIADLKSAEILDPSNPVILCSIAAAYAKDSLFVTAVEYCAKIENMNSGFIDMDKVRLLKAYSLSKLNRFDEAEILTKKILSSFPDDPVALNISGYISEKRGDIKETVSFYKKILANDSLNPTAMNSIAYLMAKSGLDLNSALVFAKKAHEKDRENPAYLDTLGFVYLKRGDYELAKKYIKQAFEKMPGNEEIKSHLNELLKL